MLAWSGLSWRPQISTILGIWISGGISSATRIGESNDPTLRVSITRVPVWTTTNKGGGILFFLQNFCIAPKIYSNSSSWAYWCSLALLFCPNFKNDFLAQTGWALLSSKIHAKFVHAPSKTSSTDGLPWISTLVSIWSIWNPAFKSAAKEAFADAIARRRLNLSSHSRGFCQGPPWSRAK